MKSYKSIDNNNDKLKLIESIDIEDVLEVDTQGQYIDDSSEGPFVKIIKVIAVFIVAIAFVMIVSKEDKNGIMAGNGYVTMTQTLDKSSFKITIYVDSPTYQNIDIKDYKYDVYVQPNEKTKFSVKKFKIDDVDIRNFEDKYDIQWYANSSLIATGNDIDYKFENEGVYDASISMTELSSSTSKISTTTIIDTTKDDDSFTYDFTLAVEKYSKSKSKSKSSNH